MKIVVATSNEHKVKEIAAELHILGLEFISIKEVIADYESPIENANTFEGNAAIKAMAAFERSGMPALADDSGLMVDALGGAPGIHSARYAGDGASDADNNAKLLNELAQVEALDRSARFVSVLVLVGLDTVIDGAPAYLAAEGTCEGMISREARGDQGFGYDPLFAPLDTPGLHMAELNLEEKNDISHRGNALKKLEVQLRDLL